MKKLIILFVFTGLMSCSFAQETFPATSEPILTRQAYLQKSKAQRTGAIVLVSAGGAMALAGLIVLVNDAANQVADDLTSTLPYTKPRSSKKHTAAGVGLVVAGLGAIAVSIGLFKSGHKNKVRGMALSFQTEPGTQLPGRLVFSGYVSSLSLKIRL